MLDQIGVGIRTVNNSALLKRETEQLPQGRTSSIWICHTSTEDKEDISHRSLDVERRYKSDLE